MQTRRLGAQGPVISVVGFGAAEIGLDEHLGPKPEARDAVATVQAALDAGINWIDTAEYYGGGLSEELVGRAVQGRRDQVVLATKVAPSPWGSGFRPKEIHGACETSLRRLGCDWIDLYHLHFPDETSVPLEESWGAMAELVDEGKVRAIGVSNFDREQIERCLAIRHVDSLEPHFSMLYLHDRELVHWCAEQGIGVVAFGPLAYGLLAGPITRETRFADDDWRGGHGDWSYYSDLFAPGKWERSHDVVDGLRPIADRLGISLAKLALAWTFQHEGVTSAIAGTVSAAHVRENAAAGELVLDQETLDEIEALLPLGPTASKEAAA